MRMILSRAMFTHESAFRIDPIFANQEEVRLVQIASKRHGDTDSLLEHGFLDKVQIREINVEAQKQYKSPKTS